MAIVPARTAKSSTRAFPKGRDAESPLGLPPPMLYNGFVQPDCTMTVGLQWKGGL